MDEFSPKGLIETKTETRSCEPWWREWPLLLAMFRLLRLLLGKSWLATALGRHVRLIA